MDRKYSLNRMIKPGLSLQEFFCLSKDSGCTGIELRNDINDGKILDGMKPEDVKVLANDYGQKIISINAIQKFNLLSCKEKTLDDLDYLIDISLCIGCEMIVLCPNNEKYDTRSKEQCYAETVEALKYIGNLLKNTGIIGLVEPLGFPISSLRFKQDAVKAINECDHSRLLKITHDTFHHFLSGEKLFYPEETGLMHVSGVVEQLQPGQYTDEHRIFITPEDIMSNVSQISEMKEKGYAGYISLEPFSSKVQKMNTADLRNEIVKTIRLVN